MTRGSIGRNEESKPTVETPFLSVDPKLVPLDQPAPVEPGKSRRKIAALMSAAGTRPGEIVIITVRSILKSLRSKGYSLTIEQGLGAIGIAIAVASSGFASFMILQEHEGQREGGALEKKFSLNGNQLGHFANADIDPMTTGSITPIIGATRGGLSGADEGAARLESLAPKLHDYVLRDVFEGVALVEGREGIRAIQPGFTLPDGNKVTAIERHDGKWVVVTTGGIISDEP